MRKILNNYKKSKRLSGTAEGRIGTILGIMDQNRNFLVVGDEVRYGKYQGILLYDPKRKGYRIALSDSMWYANDKYDINSYGKFVDIPIDNGAKMEIKLINRIN